MSWILNCLIIKFRYNDSYPEKQKGFSLQKLSFTLQFLKPQFVTICKIRLVPKCPAVVMWCCKQDAPPCALFQTDGLAELPHICSRSMSGKEESHRPELSERIICKKLFNTHKKNVLINLSSLKKWSFGD